MSFIILYVPQKNFLRQNIFHENIQVEADLDWVQMVWPKHLLSEQKDTTNVVENMKYPKVRK